MGSMSINNRMNRLLGRENDDITDDSKIFNIKDKINNIYQKDNGIAGIFPKIRNPFASNQSLAKNAPIINTNNLNPTAQNMFSSAMGVTNSAGVTNPAAVIPNNTSSSENNTATSAGNGSADGDVKDISAIGDMDVAKEMPKLSVNQIESVIKQYFGKSKVMSPSDAQGIYDAQQSTGMSALAMLGIGALESGWGTSNIANKTNNIWGYGATNNNPEGNAHRYSQMSDGAKQFSSEFMKTYYNNYGAKSINSAGTGNNPKGMGYAYNDDGSISSTWAPQINDIMKKLYNTAKGTGNFEEQTGIGNGDTSSDNNQTFQKLTTIKNLFSPSVTIPNNNISNRINSLYGKSGTMNKYYTVLPNSLQPSKSNTAQNIAQNNISSSAKSDKDDSSSDSGIVNTAKKYMGTPYAWGGDTPKGFDCSGFTQYVLGKNGKSIPRTSQEQAKSGASVDKNNLKAGDLVFFSGSNSNDHVGIYIGNGQFIHSPHTGDSVKISDMNSDYYTKHYSGAKRY